MFKSKNIRELKGRVTRNSYGVIGKSAGNGYFVGDMVVFYRNGSLRKGIVVEDTKKDRFTLLNFFTHDIRDIHIELTVVKHNHITSEILQEEELFIEEKEIMKMTKSQIEKELGYYVEIIGD